ncbi:efflux RND transporter periplasmic adaptor subunit [Pararhodospirillum photometricum]|uniref:Acriflavine resistance protein E n=1 Tax=Pararhodospirillum photometricum DSM 122 TaxID=1150469 RepID=H6SS83_PARPM|nr:efflux RND transporter periplasmic adaptor subunit [Pararhodospirillum photometricum]CCG07762.1 Acriflavine resistance protein E [Pararhodospirillum photometricum DSM 122]
MVKRYTLGRAGAFVMLGLAVAACDEKTAGPPPAPPPPEVAVVEVQPQRVGLTTELPGRTAAYRVAEVRPQVGGLIQKRLFTEGTDVKAGQQLYQIDPAPYAAELQKARAELEKAEATARAARLKAERYRKLVSGDVVSRQTFDDAVAADAEADAAIGVARAAVEVARINLDYTKVLAPISGRIGASAVTEGALVTASQTAALATVTQLDPINVNITQSSAELMRLRRDIDSGRVEKAPVATVRLKIDGLQTYEIPGTLQFAEVTVDPSTGSVRLRAEFPNPQGVLLPGLFVRAVVEQAVRDETLLVPQQSLVRRPDGSAIVWVVDAENKVAPRPVQVGQALGDRWLITEGLSAGDKVVVQGLQRLKPGIPVRVAAPPPAKS